MTSINDFAAGVRARTHIGFSTIVPEVIFYTRGHARGPEPGAEAKGKYGTDGQYGHAPRFQSDPGTFDT
jgi:hypothetical protein